MMRRLRAFGAFLYDFVIGDDWRIALGVAVAIGVTAVVSGAGGSAWWILPLFVAVALGGSLWSVVRRSGSQG